MAPVDAVAAGAARVMVVEVKAQATAAAVVVMAAEAATATELKEALRAAWWRAGHDAMHGVARHDDLASLTGSLGAMTVVAVSIRGEAEARLGAGGHCCL